MTEEKRLTVKDRDEIRDQLTLVTTNMKRMDAEFERLNTKYQAAMADTQNLKDLNSQLKDLLATYNNEAKKLREDFERREMDYQNKIAELNKALILQEKKMVDKVIESIDMKHQSYHNKNVEFDYMAKMDEEYDKLRQKRKEISEKLKDKDPIQTPPSLQPQKPELKQTTEVENIKPGTSLPPTTKPTVQIPKTSTLPTSNKFSNAPTPEVKSPKKLTDEIDDFDDDFLNI